MFPAEIFAKLCADGETTRALRCTCRGLSGLVSARTWPVTIVRVAPDGDIIPVDPDRAVWLDEIHLKYACMVNGFTTKWGSYIEISQEYSRELALQGRRAIFTARRLVYFRANGPKPSMRGLAGISAVVEMIAPHFIVYSRHTLTETLRVLELTQCDEGRHTIYLVLGCFAAKTELDRATTHQ